MRDITSSGSPRRLCTSSILPAKDSNWFQVQGQDFLAAELQALLQANTLGLIADGLQAGHGQMSADAHHHVGVVDRHPGPVHGIERAQFVAQVIEHGCKAAAWVRVE